MKSSMLYIVNEPHVNNISAYILCILEPNVNHKHLKLEWKSNHTKK